MALHELKEDEMSDEIKALDNIRAELDYMGEILHEIKGCLEELLQILGDKS